MHNTIPFRNFLSMGTRFDMVLPGLTQESADNIFSTLKAELNRLEDKLSNYKDDSALSILNRYAFEQPFKVDTELFTLLEELIDLSSKTEGYFDFSMGKYTSNAYISSDKGKDFQSDKPLTSRIKGFEKILLNKEKSTIKFASGDISVDSSGFGKGKALDKVKEMLQIHQTPHAFISFGNSSILAHGKHPHGETWKTGIANLFLSTENVFVFDLKDECISVSGTTPQNLEKYGRSHIIDPFTGKEVEGFFQCAVAGSNGLTTEVLSTALSCAPLEKRDRIMQNFKGYDAVIIEYKNEEPTITYNTIQKNERIH